MKKIKARLARAKSAISIKTYKKPLLFVILTMVFINLLILTVAAVIAWLIDDSFASFLDAFANGSMKWMLTPNAILDITNPNTLFLAVLVLITGLILFSGTIIALTTNAIKDYFQKKKSGSGKIHLDQHVVILNWNNKVPELVADLYFVQSKDITVMILADIDKDYAEKQILNAVRKSQSKTNLLSKMNVLVKHGDPMLRSDLDDISIEKAQTILVMNPDQHDVVLKDMSKSDLAVIKVILGLGAVDFAYDPPIVVEIKHFESKAKIITLGRVVETLHNHDILPICFDKRLGQIIAQTLIEPRMEDVYLSLFSFDGSEIYLLENKTFDACLNEHAYAVPVARHGDHLFVMSLTNETKNRTSPHAHKPLKLVAKPIHEAMEMDIHIIGENNKLQFIREAFDNYEAIHQGRFKAKWVDENDLTSFTRELVQQDNKASILLLSDETQKDDALDANVINNIIYLEGHLEKPDVNIIVELLNPKNDPIVKDFNIRNTIISNKIISLLLSKLALFKETAPFYEDLLTIAPDEKGIDKQSITIRRADVCLEAAFPLRFESKKQLVGSIYEAFGKERIILGYLRHEAIHILEGNLHQNESIVLEAGDELILIRI
ncbi:MAG: hypothetical protein EA375_06355 [Acholeplasmataceae bacterium]|nr:MAG: hypothetical protein EA375_06355 [Acholeplasmataceae bacterium]